MFFVCLFPIKQFSFSSSCINLHVKQSLQISIKRSKNKLIFCYIISQTIMAVQKQVMVFGMDDSEHSNYALDWTLTHLFTPESSPFKLIVVHAKPSPATAIGLGGPGLIDVLPTVDSDLKKIAARVLEKAKTVCASKSVNDVTFEAVEGDARNVLCEAVERHHAAMLVLGNHGHGAIKRAVLGSVSDYCAHHAHCTVTIVKKPKTKH